LLFFIVSILFRPATDCVLLESQLVNELRSSFARQAGRSALRSAGRKGSMFSIYLHFCLHLQK